MSRGDDTKKKLIIPGWGDGNFLLPFVKLPFTGEEIDNPRMRGRKLKLKIVVKNHGSEEIDNPRMRGRKHKINKTKKNKKAEEIDNPRMRGRKLSKY